MTSPWLYTASVPQFIRMLKNLDHCVELAITHAQTKSFDPAVYFSSRLAPDQFPFSRQVQSVCDTAKFAVARLTGKDAPSHPDTEQTLDELRARIQTCVSYLESFKPEDFDGADKRMVTTPRWEGKSMTTADYLLEHAQPNLYFHVTTAYAILRHNGVGVGKRDYLGPLTLR